MIFANWLTELLHKEWFLGLLGGVGATLLGFVCTLVWDVRKMRADAAERARAIRETVSEDLTANKQSIASNLAALQQELSALSRRESIVNALQLMRTGFWEIAKSNTPSKVFGAGNLVQLRDIGSRAEDVNEQVRSRENYRIHNGAMSNFNEIGRASCRERVYVLV